MKRYEELEMEIILHVEDIITGSNPPSSDFDEGGVWTPNY